MEHLSNDYEDQSNQHKNSHKLCNEMRHPVLSLFESQWKLIPGFKLAVHKMRFAIHFDNFTEHFFLIFVNFTNQYLIVNLSFIFKQR